MKKEAIIKFGSIYQSNFDHISGFNADADIFLTTYNQYREDIQQQGYNRDWDNWKENNQDLIIRLYDALEMANLIPKSN